MSESRTERRKIRIVDRPDQLRIVRSATYPMIAILVFALLAQAFFDFQLQRLAIGQGVEITGLARRFTSTLLFFTLATGWHIASSIRLSNRASGAAYRMKETLRQFREGNGAVRANLRDGDLHQALAGELNSFLDWAEPRLSAGQSSAAPAVEHREEHSRPGVETTVA
jgi:hypothetical protein